VSEDKVKSKVLLGDVAIKRFPESSEIVKLCAWLCSDAAKSITQSDHRLIVIAL
jgi:hypothetical protein